ncbi:MAG: hypothetical protein KF839_01810 [Nitrosomonas sp.]|nr:hypothetical protein [Nitrosomonas sp.]
MKMATFLLNQAAIDKKAILIVSLKLHSAQPAQKRMNVVKKFCKSGERTNCY